jgi:hypothetical protein
MTSILTRIWRAIRRDPRVEEDYEAVDAVLGAAVDWYDAWHGRSVKRMKAANLALRSAVKNL